MDHGRHRLCPSHIESLSQAEPGWAGLGWAGLGWAGLVAEET